MKHIHGLGARSLKTVLAVAICLFTSGILNLFALPTLGFYAAVAAVITMQTTLELSWLVGKHRSIGTIVGGLITIFLLYLQKIVFFGQYGTIFAVLGVGLVIFVCSRLNIPLGISTAAIIVLSGFELYSVTIIVPTISLRVVETIYGVIIALLINQYIRPPKPLEQEQKDVDV